MWHKPLQERGELHGESSHVGLPAEQGEPQLMGTHTHGLLRQLWSLFAFLIIT